MEWIVAVPTCIFLALLGIWLMLYVHEVTHRRKKKPTINVEVSTIAPPVATRTSIPADQRVPTLHQISVIYTANFTATQRQRSIVDDLPPSYESVVISLPPPIHSPPLIVQNRTPSETAQLSVTPNNADDTRDPPSDDSGTSFQPPP